MNFSRGFLQWAAAGLVALAILLRAVGLDQRPVIHDESMFAYYAWSAMRNGHYTHLPILHGPTLILITGRVFSWFGDSIATGRAWIAAISLVVLAAGMGLWPRRYRWWFAPVLFTSPILLYYSRFLRNEMLFSAVLMVGLLGAARGISRRQSAALWAMPGAACLIGLIAIKENALFVWATLASFGLVYAVRRLVWRGPARALRPRRRRRPRPAAPAGPPARLQRGTYMNPSYETVVKGRPGAVSDALSSGTETPRGDPAGVADAARESWLPTALAWIWGAALGCGFVYFIYHVTTGPDSRHALANLASSWTYWREQHQLHRISGPIHYYLPILLLYELPALLLLAAGLVWDAGLRRRRGLVYLGAVGLWLLVWLAWIPLARVGFIARVGEFLHVEPNGSMLVLGVIIAVLLAWSILQLEQHRPLASFIGWWAACSLFQYSSAGEKVPWLAVHIALPLIMMLGWVWAPRLRTMGRRGRALVLAWLVLTFAVALRNDYFLIFQGRDSDPRERIVYNHTSPRFDALCRQLLSNWEVYSDEIPLARRRVVLIGAPFWPGVWYFRDCNWVSPAQAPEALGEGDDLIIGDQSRLEDLLRRVDMAEWNALRLSLRNAWVPAWPPGRPETDTWAESLRAIPAWLGYLGRALPVWWKYYWDREPWTPTGEYPIIAIEPMTMRR
ncbi:MAG TPA: TIGR03663 family protein [Candidatus Sumerlaeota bacterium]|nr:TIGR03663 family protein [Candidatus Sumerlaeota bacterium]HPK01840.1 TIGR03663 family protein [Candidatus Sumerlaeota bacterium]